MMAAGGKGILKVAQHASKTAFIDSARATGTAIIVLGGSYLYDKMNSSSHYGFFKSRPAFSEPIKSACEDAHKVESNIKIK